MAPAPDISLILLSEVLCPPLEAIPQVSIVGGLSEQEEYPYQSSVQVICNQGTKFLDGTDSKDIICTAQGTWSETNLACQCE